MKIMETYQRTKLIARDTQRVKGEGKDMLTSRKIILRTIARETRRINLKGRPHVKAPRPKRGHRISNAHEKVKYERNTTRIRL
jgi:hypothetical protein